MTVNRLMGLVRELSPKLRPAMLDDLGLLPALLWHVERFSTQTNVKVDMRHSGLTGRFSLEVETAAYRIVQEALTNVARHAGVRIKQQSVSGLMEKSSGSRSKTTGRVSTPTRCSRQERPAAWRGCGSGPFSWEAG